MALELLHIGEGGDIEGDDEVTGIGDGFGIGVEVDHVLAECRAVQGSGQEAEDQRQPIALRAADGQQKAFAGASGVGQRIAHAIDHPALRHGFAAQRLGLDLAIGGDRRRHVEHDRRVLPGGNGDGNRIGAQEHVRAAPWRQVVGAADGDVEADHVAGERHHGIERRRAGMVAVVSADPGDAGCRGLLHRQLGGAAHHQMTQRIVAIQHRHGGALFFHRNGRTGVDAAGLNALDILRQPENAVAVGADQIGLRHQRRDLGGIAGRHAAGHKGPRNKGFKIGLADAPSCHAVRLCRVRHHTAWRSFALGKSGTDKSLLRAPGLVLGQR